MDGHAGNVTAADLHFADVDTGADLNPQWAYGRGNRQSAVNRHTRAGKDRQKSVAGGFYFAAAEALELFADDVVVVIQEIVPPVVAEGRGTFGRADDVGEEDRGH